MRLEVSLTELRNRRSRVMAEAAQRNMQGICTFGCEQIFYLTNLRFFPTERPVCLVLFEEKVYCLAPRLEEERIGLYSTDVIPVPYPEYPGTKHPMHHLRELLTTLGLTDKTIGVDSDGAPSVFGYEGPAISELVPEASIVAAKDIIDNLRKVKTDEEIELIRESTKWGNLAHTLLQKYTAPGLSENEISLRAYTETALAIERAFGERNKSFWGSAEAGLVFFRGQVGAYTAYPHALNRNAIIKSGDLLISGVVPAIGGYHSELERTMVVGSPTPRIEKYFDLMLTAQQVAFDAIRPGAPCSAVDNALTAFYEENELLDYWRSHTGHGLGLGEHEAPFFDSGDHTVMEPGMVFSVEPGIFIPDFGGFRHSDTVLVTEGGVEILTYYPRDLESLII